MRNKYDYILTVANELQITSEETHDLLKMFTEELQETRDLYAVDKDTSHSPLLKLGITLLILPDPISTPIGAGVLLFGLTQEKLVGPPIYIKDIYEKFNQNMQELLNNSDSFKTSSITAASKS
jgi:hypothetical protein